VIIGLDGVPISLIKRLTEQNVMPNLKEVLKDGVLRKMRSSLPEVSAVSWSSIITGKNPGEHGVFGFTDLLKGFYVLSFHSSKKLKAAPFWRIDRTRRYVIINLPATYPAGEVNGVLISGFVSPDIEGAVYPKSYLRVLRERNYRIDVDVEKARQSESLFIQSLMETLDSRLKVADYFWKNIKWDIFMLVFTGTDRLEHFLWDAYEDPNNIYHQDFLKFFSAIDEAIGEITSRISEEDSLVMLSDHGMERIEVNVNLNSLLVEEGFLVVENNPRKNYNSIKRETKAFALEPSRVYLHRKGRYPRGSVEKNDEEHLLSELEETFYSLRYKGRKVIRKVWRRNEIYKGKFKDEAPDLVLTPEKGFNLRAKLFSNQIFEREHELTGKHTWDDAFFYMKGVDADDVPLDFSAEDALRIAGVLKGD